MDGIMMPLYTTMNNFWGFLNNWDYSFTDLGNLEHPTVSAVPNMSRFQESITLIFMILGIFIFAVFVALSITAVLYFAFDLRLNPEEV